MDRKADTLAKTIRNIKSVYTNKYITIKTLFMDNKFEVIKNTSRGTELNLNTTTADEHVPEIERQIKVVK